MSPWTVPPTLIQFPSACCRSRHAYYSPYFTLPASTCGPPNTTGKYFTHLVRNTRTRQYISRYVPFFRSVKISRDKRVCRLAAAAPLSTRASLRTLRTLRTVRKLFLNNYLLFTLTVGTFYMEPPPPPLFRFANNDLRFSLAEGLI